MVRRTYPRRATLVGASLLLLIILPAAPAKAVLLFSDGFETGNLSNWSSSANVTVQSTITFAGSFAARATTSGSAAYALKQLAGSHPDLYMDARVNLVSNAGTTTLLRTKSATGTKVVSLNIQKTNKLQLKNHSTGGTLTSATVLPTGGWHELQLHVLVNGGSSQVEAWLDGVRVNDISGTQSLGSAQIGQVEIGTNGSSSGFDVVFDDVVVDTAFIGGGGTAPAPPTNLHTTSVSASQVSLAWDASAGATSYNVYRDGGLIGSPVTTSFQDTTVDPETEYSYTVDACNAVGCSAQTSPLVVTTPPAGGGDTIVMAAGDIACDPTDPDFNNGNGTKTHCRQAFTAPLLSAADAVLAVGDTQYECAGTAAYAQSYNPSWGQFKSLTFPTIGDEEYADTGTDCGAPGADGYFGYFGAVSHPESDGYYSFDLGSWHIIVLNSECHDIDEGNAPDGCAEGSPQNDWLEADLAANTAACTLATLHKPLFASKKNGPQTNTDMQPFWDDLYPAGVELIFGGNSHFYERFEPQTPAGQADPNGVVQWVVGTGGKSHGGLAALADRLPTSETGNNKTFGVLKLTLHPSSYDWEFLVEGSSTFTDTGTASCH